MEIIYNVFLWTLLTCHAARSQDECNSALGMENNKIPDESITASSELTTGHSPSLARLYGPAAWCSKKEESPYIQISLDEEKLITAVKTQGSQKEFSGARKYSIKYLEKGNWTSYHKELMGNSNSGSVNKNTLQPQIRTTSIRIYPKEPFSISLDPDAVIVPCLRLELYGCSAPAGCNDPGSPLNGERRGNNFDHGKQITFVCQQDYVLVGSSTSVCHRGQWSHGVPECKATCKDPGLPSNGERRGDTFIDGDSVEFTCHERYTLIGSSVIRCLGNRWSSVLPQCKASCPNPGVPKNGERIGSNFGHGSNVQFKCQSGFWLVGSRLIECSEGKWSNAIPECRAVCSNPGAPTNGERIGDDFGDGQMVAYRCNSGFNLVGSATAHCVSGQWNATKPSCKASCIHPGAPKHGRLLGSNFGHGNEVTFFCRQGFSLIGSQTITCHGGKWSSAIPVCKAACQDPGSPENGEKHGHEFGHNKQVRFSCQPGYRLIGSAPVIVCINGKWSAPIPECKAVCSDPQTPVNGERIGNSFLDGQTVAFRCRSGYTLIGPQVLRCVKGRWNKKRPQCKALCPNPDVPLNGRLVDTGSGRQDGQKAKFACNPGFKMEGSSTITCNNGTWSPSAPLCKDIDECSEGLSDCHASALCTNTEGSFSCACADGFVGDGKTCSKSCADPGAPINGDRRDNDFRHGKTVTFTCRSGYKMIGRPSIKCQDGIWSSALPKCQDIDECSDDLSDCHTSALCTNTEGSFSCACANGFVGDGKTCSKSCMDPGVPTNGDRRGDDFLHGKTVIFTCRSGYKMIGRPSIKCQDGIWSSALPNCQSLCKMPDNLDNGVVIKDRFATDEIIEFACNSGYKLIGSSVLRCTRGQWNSSRPECRTDACPAPAQPAHGSIKDRDFSNGKSVRFSCDPQYTLVGFTSITCLDGRWIGKPPVCQAACPPPARVSHGFYEGSTFDSGASVRYTCDAQYTLDGPAVISCIAGRWDNKAPVCRAPCTLPVPPLNGFVFGDSPQHLNSAQYWCKEGFTLRGSSSRQCHDGKWDSPAPVCQGLCKIPDNIENGVVITDRFATDEIIEFACNSGYKLIGSPVLRCTLGQWNNSRPECRTASSPCQKPDIPINAFIKSSQSHKQWFDHGDIAFYGCYQGYAPSGILYRRCNKGTWTRLTFRCNARSCGDPGEPFNGKINSHVFTYQSMVQYSCGDGYTLVGHRTRTCQANQTWTGTQPQCTKINCGNLPSPINGEKITETSTILGSEVRFQCIGSQFKLVGHSTRTCLASGKWSGEQPVCKLIVCGDPGTPEHGTKIVRRGFYFGGSVEFKCNNKYILKGAPRIYCKESGSWSNSKPQCLAPCSNPGSPRNGRRIGDDFRHGRDVRFRCYKNFQLDGSKKMRCSDGRWSTRLPKCVRESS